MAKQFPAPWSGSLKLTTVYSAILLLAALVTPRAVG
jgi:hypothetical protein